MAARFLCQFGDTAVKDSPLRRVPEKPAMVALFEFGWSKPALSHAHPTKSKRRDQNPRGDRLASLSAFNSWAVAIRRDAAVLFIRRVSCLAMASA
jgi:hypothetical protein